MAAVPMAAAQRAVPMAAVPVSAVPMAPMAAVPMAAVPMAATPIATAPMVAQAVPVAGFSQAANAVPDLGLHDDSSDDTYRPRYRRQTSSGSLAILGIGFLMLAALGVAGFLYKDQLLAALEDQPQTIEVVSGERTHKPKETEPDTTAPSMNPATAAARAGGGNATSQPNGRDPASMDLSSPGLMNRPLPDTKAIGIVSKPSTPRMADNRPVVRNQPVKVAPNRLHRR